MNRDHLKRVMKKHDWSMEQVATIANVSQHTVRAWLRPNTSKASRNMRPQAEKLLNEAVEKASPKSRTAAPAGTDAPKA